MQALERAVRLINNIISKTQSSPAKDNGSQGRAKVPDMHAAPDQGLVHRYTLMMTHQLRRWTGQMGEGGGQGEGEGDCAAAQPGLQRAGGLPGPARRGVLPA